MYVHRDDDPYELAFYFLLDNGLRKDKINVLVQQIVQIQKQDTSLSGLRPSVYPTTRPNTEVGSDIKFQGNFDCGNGLIVPLVVRRGEDAERYYGKCDGLG